MKIEERDISKLHSIGIKREDLLNQISLLTTLTEKIKIVKPASAGNGILQLSDSEKKSIANFYHNYPENLEIVNFIPASGAASRMFKSLVNHLQENQVNSQSQKFFDNITKFPFYTVLKENVDPSILENVSNPENQLVILDTLLNENGLNYSRQPKGLIPFHKVSGQARTAFEEHLHDAARLVSDNKNVRLHFTVGLNHRDEIKMHLKEAQTLGTIKDITIQYSLQSKTTDTAALLNNGQMLRDERGDLVFRPGGHGALLNNLNNIHADLIYLKNIDNVISTEKVASDKDHRSEMAGYLLQIKDKRDLILKSVLSHKCSEKDIHNAFTFIREELALCSEMLSEGEDVKTYVIRQLDRPIRICGMVKNEGEPGGGPFSVEKDGQMSLQIVEASQIDVSDQNQMDIMQSATHFNPVDIVCATRNHVGEKYDLFKFRENNTSFISNKTYNGIDIRALEWPGLWNGGMFYWITFFMEIPSEVFNPVKTVNDLLKKAHQ